MAVPKGVDFGRHMRDCFEMNSELKGFKGSRYQGFCGLSGGGRTFLLENNGLKKWSCLGICLEQVWTSPRL